jgi:hypothetical protein
MKIAIMQPYFMPYIGYFQLINAVDVFVLYDNIEYTKKGWINRNRILVNGNADYISLPIKKDSDYLNVNNRFLSETWSKDKIKLLNKIKESYRKAPFYDSIIPLIEESLNYSNQNLFYFLKNSIHSICNFLDISTLIVESSSLEYDNNLRSQDKVLTICNSINATTYINPEGGHALYSKNAFSENNIDLFFLKTKDFNYLQYRNEFVPFLSIIDVLMFNGKCFVKEQLNEYNLF